MTGANAKIKRIYVGTTKVRPNPIVCDFTQSDCGFTYVTQAGPGTITHGRDSNGLWTKSTGAQGGTSWHIPSSIYSVGNLKKAVFEFSGGATKNGGGFGTDFDTKRMRNYTGLRVIWGTQNQRGTGESSPAGIWTFTADLENKILSSSISNITMALTDNAISAFNTDWNAGNVNVHTLAYTANTYAYIRKITFYF